jgi:predicted nucleotidyltransferase
LALYSKDHLKFLKALLKHNVKFIIIGGHAAIYYGVNRNTGDLDILIEPSSENGERLIKALENIKLEIPDIRPEEFTQKLVLSFGLEPDAVDILNYTPGIDFESAHANSILVNFSGLNINMIDIRDLIRNKESLQRKDEKAHLDKYDAEVLKKILKRIK